MRSYHDHKHRKVHSFVVGDIVYLARNKSDSKPNSKFDMVKYLIIDFVRRDTSKVLSTLDAKVYSVSQKERNH